MRSLERGFDYRAYQITAQKAKPQKHPRQTSVGILPNRRPKIQRAKTADFSGSQTAQTTGKVGKEVRKAYLLLKQGVQHSRLRLDLSKISFQTSARGQATPTPLSQRAYPSAKTHRPHSKKPHLTPTQAPPAPASSRFTLSKPSHKYAAS
jgi:hypothetical protein